ncbi:MAG: threonine-phosphate decarboxylase CobD [Pseudomonadota bacterium]
MSSLPEQTAPLHPPLHLPLHHGGRLCAAAARYGIALDQWLDLSTGINPNGWPVPAIPAACWARLPEDDDELEQAAQIYYEAEYVLPVAGSQAAIQALPRLRPRSRVAVLDPGYAEHACAWRRAGHAVSLATAERVEEAVAQADVLVLIHPNNPSGARFPVKQLLHWHARVAARGGWLVVDEAFMDVTPEHSLCRHTAREGLIVLRSLGKFFGLAGARVGFVCAQASLLAQLHGILGPWSVSAPARLVATSALTDRAWQDAARQRLGTDGTRLQALLARHGHNPDGGCALFQWLRTPDAQQLHEALARQGILTRLFIESSSLRFGLPGDEIAWARLDAALSGLTVQHPAEAVL